MNLGNLKAKNQNFLVTRYQTSGQIAGAILKAIDESKASAQELAPYFKNKNPYTSAKLIFLFCKQAVPYVKEPSTKQTAKTLPRILQDGALHGGDCKHYAILSSSLCKALGIPVKLRLISQNFYDRTPNHIYSVATINGKEVIIDGVLKNFDTEARYNHKYDLNLL
jgi:hypothetical protein